MNAIESKLRGNVSLHGVCFMFADNAPSQPASQTHSTCVMKTFNFFELDGSIKKQTALRSNDSRGEPLFFDSLHSPQPNASAEKLGYNNESNICGSNVI